MGEVTPFRRPINWSKLREDDAERIINERARGENTVNVIFTDHAWERVNQREITREDVFKILRGGHCAEPPRRNEKGQWQVIMSKRLQGSREAGAVTVIFEGDEKLVVRTVQWMDVR